MPKFGVTLPITGIVHVEVEAETEKEAIEAALCTEVSEENLVEWETHDQIVKGNVFSGHTNEAYAEEL